MSRASVDGCVVYTTDSSYMFPTLVSAMQARQHTSATKADVIIFCVDLDRRTEDIFAAVCEQEGIGLMPVERTAIEGQTAMLARLFLDRFVPSKYRQCLYLDSDVHILHSLDPLMDVEVPQGHFLAANDPMTFLLADNGSLSRKLGQHLLSIGLSQEQSLQYFNSGVLRICREGWRTIGSDAWEQFQRMGRSSRFPDQDALNLVGAERRLPMSLAWNFPIFMRHSRVKAAINPRIEHFMSSPKPWHGAFPPWTSAAYRPYRSALKKYPSLAVYAHGMPASTRAVYHVQQRGKQMLETLTWGFSERRSRILAYEAECLFAAAAMGSRC
ncbi:glycosyltransferase family 8 protein [Granulicella arctica]|uniref:Lipopolysaccharide biosynthesis glycosyltransferase n=1 Tax=Granulicella arctica TaxID=940613 RepID=A0A7Y9TGW4_9BACT|nr:glycosyltransferase [Granulicella arctica]NYF79929.1 lipopolysaccharide biosynthesis glycosyltransferase [Granulicella arctica]